MVFILEQKSKINTNTNKNIEKIIFLNSIVQLMKHMITKKRLESIINNNDKQQTRKKYKKIIPLNKYKNNTEKKRNKVNNKLIFNYLKNKSIKRF